ncbi:Aste57867_3692 [Aphanomyces stellatus]|uniref:Aste57867_3692 protein n=1 Tax=Aphanomyces stellatus TaxID=120398 RepID=A0A485KB27_9STRA|nr:hypothetical protein As57867_003681 [Aphanomyces stellatus]VFT80847.1 Aste57867_3692 [Aphanomyces stellatus]
MKKRSLACLVVFCLALYNHTSKALGDVPQLDLEVGDENGGPTAACIAANTAPSAVSLVHRTGGSLHLVVHSPCLYASDDIAVLEVHTSKGPPFVVQANASSMPLTVSNLDGRAHVRVVASIQTVTATSPRSDTFEFDTTGPHEVETTPAPTVLSVSGGAITLQLHRPLDTGGSRLLGYDIYLQHDGSWQRLATMQPLDTLFTLTHDLLSKPLRPSTTYTLGVHAVNAYEWTARRCTSNGSSTLPSTLPLSSSSLLGEAAATTLPPDLPRHPFRLHMFHVDETSARFQVFPPRDLNGTIVLAYVVTVTHVVIARLDQAIVAPEMWFRFPVQSHGDKRKSDDKGHGYLIHGLTDSATYDVNLGVQTSSGELLPPTTSSPVRFTTLVKPTAPTTSHDTTTTATVRRVHRGSPLGVGPLLEMDGRESIYQVARDDESTVWKAVTRLDELTNEDGERQPARLYLDNVVAASISRLRQLGEGHGQSLAPFLPLDQVIFVDSDSGDDEIGVSTTATLVQTLARAMALVTPSRHTILMVSTSSTPYTNCNVTDMITSALLASPTLVVMGLPGVATIQSCAADNVANDWIFRAGSNVTLSNLHFRHVALSVVQSEVHMANTTILGGGHVTNRGCLRATSSTLFLDSVTLVSGMATFGGGLALHSCNCVAKDVVVVNNSATHGGGGIYCTGQSHLDIHGSHFHGNQANQGGAIYAGPRIQLRQHIAQGNNTSDEGGIWISSPRIVSTPPTISSPQHHTLSSNQEDFINVKIHRTVFQGNVATEDGGAIWTSASNLALDNVVATNNVARHGGAMHMMASQGIVRDSLFQTCVAHAGGAIYASLSSTLHVERTTYRACVATQNGGALYIQSSVRLVVNQSQFEANFARVAGAGIYIRGVGGSSSVEDAIEPTILESTVLSHNEASHGGSGTILLSSNCYKRDAGMWLTDTVARIRNCSFVGNGHARTEAHGGGLVVMSSHVVVQGSTFSANLAQRGAGVVVDANSTVAMNKVNLTGNVADEAGGGLWVHAASVVSLEGCRLQHNRAIKANGGGLLIQNLASAELDNSLLVDNAAVSGGAIYQGDGSTMALHACMLIRNEAVVHGGGLYSLSPHRNISQCHFSNNTASQGGAMFLHALFNTTTQMDRRVSGNRATDVGSGQPWQRDAKSSYLCQDCLFGATDNVASTPVALSLAWWPPVVHSGISIGLNLADFDAGDVTNDLFTEGGYVWPQWKLLDVYHQPSRLLDGLRCFLYAVDDAVKLEPSFAVVHNARLIFAGLVIHDTTPGDYMLELACPKASTLGIQQILLRVQPCPPAFAPDANGDCQRCDVHSYSMDGATCFPCPSGAACTDNLISIVPAAGLPISTTSVATATPSPLCNVTLWRDDDPCRPFATSNATMAQVLAQCKMAVAKLTYILAWPPTRESLCLGGHVLESKSTGVASPQAQASFQMTPASSRAVDITCNVTSPDDPCFTLVRSMHFAQALALCNATDPFQFALSWPPERVFLCLTGQRVISCPTPEACLASPAVNSSNVTSSCADGYGGDLCTSCQPTYSKTTKGECIPCSLIDANHMYTWRNVLLPTFMGLVFGLVVWALRQYLADATEVNLIQSAHADRKLGASIAPVAAPATHHTPVSPWLTYFQSTWIIMRYQRAVNRCHVFGVRVEVPTLVVNPDKIKIMVGFLQIFGNVNAVYKLVWPPAVHAAMSASAPFNLDWTAVVNLECLFHVDFFVQYTVTLGSIALFLLLLVAFYWRSARVYKAQLDALPRTCVRCGISVMKSLTRQVYEVLSDRRTRPRSPSVTRVQLKVKSTATHQNKTMQRELGMSQLRKNDLPVYVSQHEACPSTSRLQGEIKARVVRSNLRLWQSRVKLRLNYQTYKNKCLRMAFWVLLLLYPMVAQKILLIFRCQPIGPATYLVNDPSLVCAGATYYTYFSLGCAGVGLWVVGVPFYFWYVVHRERERHVAKRLSLLSQPAYGMLRKKWLLDMHDDMGHELCDIDFLDLHDEYLASYMKRKNLEDPLVQARIGFIYADYGPHYWWYEVLDLMRKLTMNGLILFANDAVLQSLLGVFVCLLSMMALLFFKPYTNWTNTVVASIAQFSLFLTLALGFVLNIGSAPSEGMAYAILATNGLTLLFAGWLVLKDVVVASVREFNAIARRRKHAIRAAVRKKWSIAFRYALYEATLRGFLPHRRICIPILLELVRRHLLDVKAAKTKPIVRLPDNPSCDHGLIQES